MDRSTVCRALTLLGLVGVLGGSGAAKDAQSQALPREEFVGPFASWRQVTCGGVDDTVMLQRELDALGTPGHSPILYLRPGTCVIRSTLHLSHKEGITLLGADPSKVTIRWAGVSGGQMMHMNGVAYSRFGRITWDGGGRAGVIYRLQWSGDKHPFPTGNRHEDEVLQNAEFGIRAGNNGTGGEAETTIVRSRFRNLSKAGINLEDYNALDWWIWWSRFENTNRAITNNYFNGSGNFHVYNSVFVNNAGGDLSFTNTGLFSARGNWSSGSAHFLYAGPIGSAPALVTLQGNTIQDTTRSAVAMYQPGPLVLIDNTFRVPGRVPLEIQEAYTSYPTADVVAVGNTYDAAKPYAYVGGRVRNIDDTVGSGAAATPAPAMPQTPVGLGRRLFEPRQGNIQAAIDAAVASRTPRAIVHIPHGTYAIQKPLVVPPGVDIQIVGDGLARTTLRSAGVPRVLWLQGPSRAVVRDLSIVGGMDGEGISVDAADHAGGAFRAEELTVKDSHIGVMAGGLKQTVAELTSFAVAASTGPAVRVRHGSRLGIVGGAAANNRIGFDVREQSTLTVRDTWYDRGATQHIAPGGSGSIVWNGGRLAGNDDATLDVSTFQGSVSLINQLATTPVKGGANTLALGLVASQGEWSAGSPPWAAWANRTFLQGGGSQQAIDQQSRVTDPNGFLRGHVDPLRAASVRAEAVTGGAMDVRLLRVAVLQATQGVAVTAWRVRQ